MYTMKITRNISLAVIALTLLSAGSQAQVKQASFSNAKYRDYRDSIYKVERSAAYDSVNLFDNDAFVPGKNSFDTFLLKMEAFMISEDQKENYNSKSITQFRSAAAPADPGTCKELNCLLYAEVVKSEQKLYLFLNGEPLDTFDVSTGTAGYETPNLNLRPSGPIFQKYSSKKFPGGNYQGLGNMPYAVFLKGGYAIHGTTTGNFSKLGSPASHGCVRLHPDNARVFNDLVREVGLENTWVKIVD